LLAGFLFIASREDDTNNPSNIPTQNQITPIERAALIAFETSSPFAPRIDIATTNP